MDRKNYPVRVLMLIKDEEEKEKIRTILEAHYEVLIPQDEPAATDMIKRKGPGLIVCNQELRHQIKQDPLSAQVPLIIIHHSNRPTSGTTDNDLEAQLTEPYSGNELLILVHSQIKISRIKAAAEKKLQNILSQAPTGICILRGPQHKIEAANKKMLAILGSAEASLLETPIAQVIHPIVSEQLVTILNSVYSTGEAFVMDEVPIEILLNTIPEKIYLKLVFEPLRESDGSISGIIMMADDITSLVNARITAEEKEEQLRIALEGGDMGTSDYYPQTGELKWSAKTKEFFGFKPDAEINFDVYLNAIHPDDRISSDDAIQKALHAASKGKYENEYRTIRLSDGATRWVRSKGKIKFNSAGEPIRYSGVTQDVTSLKESLNSLEIQSLVLQHMDEGVSVSDEEGVIVITNPAEDKMFGYDPGELAGKNVAIQNAYDPGENEEKVAAVIAELKSTGTWKGEWHNRKKDGTEFYTMSYITAVKLDGRTMFVCVQRDITEEKKQRDALRESENRYSSLSQATTSVIWTSNGDGTFVTTQDSWKNYTGQKWEAHKGWGWTEMVPEEDREKIAELCKSAVAEKRIYQYDLCLWNDHYKEYRHAITKAVPILNKEGDIIEWIGSVIDIHEQKKAEEEVQRFKYMADNANDLILLMREDGSFSYLNNTALEKWGYSRDEAGNISLPDVDPAFDKKVFRATFKNAQTDSIPSFETMHKKKDGSLFPVEINMGALILHKKPFLFAIARDITERKLAEVAYKQSTERFQGAVEAVLGIVWTNDAEGRMEGLQPGWSELTGQDYGAYRGYGWSAVIHPEDRQPTVDAWQSALKNKSSFSFVHRLRTKSGAWRWFSAKAIPLITSDGKIREWVGIHTDITEQRQAEASLKESEERFRNLSDEAPMWVWMADEFVNVTYSNKALLSFIGLQNSEEFTAQQWMSRTHPDDVETIQRIFDSSFNAQTPFVLESRFKNAATGEFEWFQVNGIPRFTNNLFEGYIGTGYNIHIQKTTMDLLRYRKALLEAHNEAVLDGVLLVDAKGKIISYNHSFIGIWNMPQHIVDAKDDEAALDFAMTQLVNPQQFIDKVKYLYDNPAETSLDELDFKDGRIIERHGYPVIGEDGTYYAWSWTFRDISKQRLFEKTLKESEERFRLLADEMPQFVWIGDVEGNLNYYNRSVYEYAGLTEEEMSMNGWMQIVHPADLEKNVALWQIAISTGTQFHCEHRFRNKDGEYRWQLSRAVPQRDGNGKIQRWLGTSTDIHDQKLFTAKLEKLVHERTRELSALNKELQQSNEDLQQFAHVASHDLKEPLRKIKTFSARMLEDDETVLSIKSQGYFHKIQRASDRMFAMIDGVLTYSTTNAAEEKIQQVDLNELFESIIIDLEVLIEQKKATINYQHLPVIQGASILLYQLFYNLITNSLKFINADTVPQISITASRFNDAGIAYARVEITDNGIGFDESQKEKIFHTFSRLNSKDKYEGTGLGLSLCKKIAERHGGLITARSSPGQGSVFSVTLPLIQQKNHI